MAQPSLTIVMPALNEENNVGPAMASTLAAFDDFHIAGELIVVNDGSRDRTKAIIQEQMARDGRVRMIDHDTPHGVGGSFWEGVDQAAATVVCWLPGDNENDPWEICRYFALMDHVDLVVPFVFNKAVRTRFRNALSAVYVFIINATFRVKFHYTNGTILWRRSLLMELGPRRLSSGFFFQTDALVRLVKRGYLFAEVPYRLGTRSSGRSKALTLKSLRNLARGYFRLLWDVMIRRAGRRLPIAQDSATFRRATRRRERNPPPRRAQRDDMAVLLWSSIIFALAFCLHLLIWRIRLPRRQTRALLVIFAACLFAAIATLWISSSLVTRAGWLLPRHPAQFVHVAVVVASLTLAYLTTYSAVEVDSPSLVMVLAIAAAGQGGLPPEALDRQLSDDVLVRPRVRDLLRDGLVVDSAGKYTLTSKGRRLVRVFAAYRALLGAAKGG